MMSWNVQSSRAGCTCVCETSASILEGTSKTAIAVRRLTQPCRMAQNAGPYRKPAASVKACWPAASKSGGRAGSTNVASSNACSPGSRKSLPTAWTIHAPSPSTSRARIVKPPSAGSIETRTTLECSSPNKSGDRISSSSIEALSPP